MKYKALVAVVVLAILTTLAAFGSAVALTSTGGEFNASSSPLYINWTNASGKANIAGGVYAENITIRNNNATRNISVNITNTTGTLNNSLFMPLNFSVNNGTADDNAFIFITNGSSVNITLLTNVTGAAAGRYSGNLTIANSTNASENITTFAVYVDVPVSINTSTRIGNFSGNVSNASVGLYYFNITPFANIAGVRLDVRDINAAISVGLYDNNSTLRNTTSLNATTNSTNITFANLFPLTGLWLLNITSNNTTSSANVTFNASIELLQASLRVNTTAAPSGTFDDNVTDNAQNITVSANPGLNYTETAAVFTINNTAGYNLTVTNITLEGSASKLITNGTTTNLVLGNNTTAVTLLNVVQTGTQLNATLLLANTSNSSQNKTVNANESAANDTNWDGSAVGVSYIHLTPAPAVAAVWLGAPVVGSSNLTLGARWINYTLSLTNLTVYNGTTNSSTFTITLNTTNTANSQGTYSGWALIHTANGFPYRAFKLGLFVNLTGVLNVTVNNATNATDAATISLPGVNISINATPRYLNGTVVPNLNTSTANWGAWAQHFWQASLLNTTLKNVSLTVTGVSADNNWNYVVNATVPSYALGGNYTTGLLARDNNTANLSSGTGTFANFTLNETALSLRSSGFSNQGFCDGQSGTVGLTQGTAFYCGFNMTNYGGRNATAVNVSRSVSGCSILDSLSNTSTLGNITPGGSNATSTNASTTWYFNTSSTGTCTISITSVAGGTRWDRQNLTITLNVTAAGGAAAGGGGQDQANLTFNQTKALEITSWPAETSILQGGSASATVKVKNTGAVQLNDVRLNVSGIESGWWSVSPTANITMKKNEEKDWTISFSVPADATVANYSITYTAWATGATTAKVAKIVLKPGNATQTQINVSLANYTERYQNISTLLNQTNATGANITDAETKLAAAKALLDQAQAAIDAGDWTTALALLDQIDVSLTAAETAITQAKVEAARAIKIPWVWVGGGVAAAAIAVAVIFAVRLRRPGYYPEIGYRTAPPSGRLGERLRALAERIRNAFRRRPTAAAYPYPGA